MGCHASLSERCAEIIIVDMVIVQESDQNGKIVMAVLRSYQLCRAINH
jgi:hypothetical protein